MSDGKVKQERREQRDHREVMETLDEIRKGSSVQRSDFALWALGIFVSLVGSGLSPTVLWKCFTFGLAYVIAWAWVLPSYWPLRKLSLGWRFTAFVSVTLLLLLPTWHLVATAYASEMAGKYSGTLSPTSKLVGQPPKFPCIQLGDSLSQLCNNGIPGNDLFMLSNDTDLEIKFGKSGDPELSLVVRNSNGIVIADVENNEWSVNPDKSVSWDHNYTQDRLEVLNGEKHVVLRIQVLPDRVLLEAVLWRHMASGGFGNFAIVGADSEKPGLKQFCDKRDMTTCSSIIPEFVYPSLQHWGERVSGTPY